VAVGYTYEARDEKGMLVAKTVSLNEQVPNDEELQPPKPPGNMVHGELKPEESIETATRISEIYQLAIPGKYTIQVREKNKECRQFIPTPSPLS